MLDTLKILFSTRKQELRNSFWNIADVLILPFLMLALTPYFINKLGTEEYGIWMLVNSLIAAIGIVNFGLGDAAIKFISKYRALDDNNNIQRIFKTGWTLSLIIALIIILLGNISAEIIERYNFFNLNERNLSLAAGSIGIGAALFSFKQIEQFLISFFKGYERYDTASIISIISKFILLFSQFMVVYLGYGVIEIFISSAAVSFLIILCEIFYIKIRFSYISLMPALKRISVREIFSFGIWAWVQSILSVVAGHADRFIVITLAGPKFLAYYSLASTVGSQIHSIFSAGISWVFPKVSGKHERKESISVLYYKLQFFILAASSLVIAFLIIFEYPIFKTWLGYETYYNSILLIRLFLFLAFINMLSIVPYYFLLGTNLIRISALFMSISVLLTIAFMITGYYITGVAGLAYGKLFASLLSIPLMLVFIHYKIIDKKEILPGLKLYAAVFLFACSLYLSNIISIPILAAGAVVLWFLYKEKMYSKL